MRTAEEKRAYNRLYYARNREKMLEKAKLWRETFPERHRENIYRWRKANMHRQRQLQRDWYRRRYASNTYGVPEGWYEQTMEKQNHVCAICKQPQKYGKRKFVIDHDHETGEVRGLLCDPCNTALNRLETVQDWNSQASEYLTQYRRKDE